MTDRDGNKYMYMPEKLLLDKSLSPTAKIFYMIMCQYTPSVGSDINRWADACGLSKYQAIKAVNELIRAGYIEKKRSRHRAPGISHFYYGLYDYTIGCGHFKWLFYLKTNCKSEKATESSSAPSMKKPKAL